MAPPVPDPESHPEPFAVRLSRWLDDSPMSQDDLAYEARRFGADGMTGSYVSKLKRGVKRPSAATIAALAAAMGTSADEFPEYHLALARQLLDESDPARGGVGFSTALANLARVRAALDLHPRPARPRLADAKIPEIRRRAAAAERARKARRA